MSTAHKGQILPLVNQMIPIDKETTFHASYDYGLHGFNQGEVITPIGPEIAFDFNGVDSKVIPGKLFENTPTSVTVEVWLNARAGASGYPTVVDFGAPGSAYYMEMASETAIMIGGYVGVDGNAFSGLTNELRVNYTLNKWIHLAYTVTASDMRVYMDGVFVTNKAAAYDLSMFRNPLTIGYGRSHFNGMIAEVKVWSVAKGEEEIKAGMSQLTYPGDPHLVAYYKLNQKEGNIAYDSSGNGRDALITGSVGRTTSCPTVARVQPDGLFGKAVLIEPDTINLIPNSDYSNRTYGTVYPAAGSWGGDNGTVTYHGSGGYNNLPYKKLTKTASGTGGALLDDHIGFRIENGRTYTISVYMKASKAITHNSYAMAINRIADNAYRISGSDMRLTTEWQRFSWVYAAGADHAGDYQVRAIIYTDENLPLDVYWCGFQVEERTGVTSYVKGSRPPGRLWYPKELVNPSEFTIGFSFNIPLMHKTAVKNEGIKGNWYHPLVEIAGPTSSSPESLSILAGPNSSEYGRLLRLQSPVTSNGSLAIQDDTWYHLIVTYNGTTYRVYIDGVLQISLAGSALNLSGEQYLMVGGGSRGKPFIKIDEVRIESRAITQEEAQAWAASGLHYNYLDYSRNAD